ncbi:cupin domain-containing protein [Catalinimonas niigatensis]|uniref:cupin domain-containing protein n=1 Tax=Catalinimonas niigatensis TaxID=1397264 RepID=UPI0026659DF6|nr:cupin domain-containing protein [Catalinimonas niigatensis]WPP51960.1 cupin domain-containing protein [Catalinimonas niigatensis]
MNTNNKSEFKAIQSGNSLKVIHISGKAGMEMPLHHATKEVVVIVEEGIGILTFEGKKHQLQKGDHFIIPAQINHSLVLKTDFKATGVMLLDSTIEFE